jgi:hypothetical protein
LKPAVVKSIFPFSSEIVHEPFARKPSFPVSKEIFFPQIS